MELTLDHIYAFLEANECSAPSIEQRFTTPYIQTTNYVSKSRPMIVSNNPPQRTSSHLPQKQVGFTPMKKETPIQESPLKPPEPITLSKGKTLWEALVPFVDATAPLFTETMKQDASLLLFQTIRETLMGEWSNRCGKPSSVRACLKAMDQPELKIGMDSVSWTVLSTLFNYMWDCNLLLKEKQKEVVKGFNASTTLKIEHTKTEWVVSKI
jgi:hypothetical protein